MKQVIDSVLAFAASAHDGQRRKFANEPYINHPVRVMQICRDYNSELPVLAAAILHDVLEDTSTDRDMMSDFLATVMNPADNRLTLSLVEDLTDVFTRKNYPGLNRRERKSRESVRLAQTSGRSQTIKYADIIDNSLDIHHAEPDFARLFLYECRNLLQVMKDGDERLRSRAIDTVKECMEKQKQY